MANRLGGKKLSCSCVCVQNNLLFPHIFPILTMVLFEKKFSHLLFESHFLCVATTRCPFFPREMLLCVFPSRRMRHNLKFEVRSVCLLVNAMICAHPKTKKKENLDKGERRFMMSEKNLSRKCIYLQTRKKKINRAM